MAELLVANGLISGNVLAATLSVALTGEYQVISEPKVRGQPLDAVVVGPQGLFVLRALDWRGEVILSQRGAWSERLPDGRQVAHPSPTIDMAAGTRALRAFLADEDIRGEVDVRHFVVFTDPDVTITGAAPPGVQVLRNDDVAPIMVAQAATPNRGLPDAEVRHALAEALAEGRLGIRERAAQPFVFRSSGVLGLRRKMWTIEEAVRHMDRNPEDGIAHLRNGTLVRWLEENNAPHLAEMARECMRAHPNDMRAALEEYLLSTGLVERPRLTASPSRVKLGYVLSGQSARTELRIRRGRGRGYLYGGLRPRETWLRVLPANIDKGTLLTTVSVETEGLLITRYRTAIDVVSSASEQPISIPVDVQVMPMPSRTNRAVVRPLVGGILAAILGVGVGLMANRIGAPTPFPATLAAHGFSPMAFWPTVAGLFWFVLGVIRGARQAPAWPIPYALMRWVLRTLFWAVSLVGLAVIVLWSGQQFAAEAGLTLMESRQFLVLALALCLSALPGTVGENQSARATQEGNLDSLARLAQRPSMIGGLALILLLVAVVGVRAFNEARRAYTESPAVAEAQEWISERWTVWEQGLSNAVDDVLLRYYEERAR